MLAPSSQSDLLEILRQKLLVWEADCRPAAAAFSTGCQALDHILPGNGLCRASIVEYVAETGSGASVLALIAAREACRDGGMLVVVDWKRQFHPPAAANVGVNLENTIFVRPRTRKDELWALNQALRCPGVGAVLSWPDKWDERAFRALQLAAEAGEAVGLFVRPVSIRGRPTWSAIQLLVETLPAASSKRRLRVEILRCRNGRAGKCVEVELDDETGAIQESCALPSASELANSAVAPGSPRA